MPDHRFVSAVAALTALVVLTVASAANAQANRIYELDRIVAVVNDDVIALSELEGRVQQIKVQLRQSGTQAPADPVLRRQILERMIVDKLQVQLATTAGVQISDQELNNTVGTLAQRNQLSLREFRDVLERDGYDFAKFREQIRNELLIQRIQRQRVADRITVSNREIDNFLATVAQQGGVEEYHLAHILVAVPEGASSDQIADARTRAIDIVARLRAGGSFAETAVAESNGQRALEGGDLGWRKQNELPTLFVEAITTLPIGGVSDPVRSPSGFHILKVVEKRGSGRYVISQTHARHILLRLSELVNDQETEARLLALRRRIEGGEDFGALARAHSEDASNAIKGGDLGWLSPGATVPQFEQAMNALAIDAVSQPFKTQFGWHLVQVLARRDHDDTDQVRRSEAADKIRARKRDEEMQTWIRQIRDEAYVEYRLTE